MSGTKKLTDMNAQTARARRARSKSSRGKARTARPSKACCTSRRFDAAKKYPLLVVIHGGPTGVSRAVLFASHALSDRHLVPRGALVLEPNYRGSAGYGEKFRALNVRNLGVGDAWDVLSGVDSLIAKGIGRHDQSRLHGLEPGRLHLGVSHDPHASRFKAISVGAGISDWATYYVNTDITPFTRQYLEGDAVGRPAIYEKTSPMTYIKKAKTPTLIQHGATDQRVPLPNAFELYRGLQDIHVPTKLIIYRGFEGVGQARRGPSAIERRWTTTSNGSTNICSRAAERGRRRGRVTADGFGQSPGSVLFQRHLDRFQAVVQGTAGATFGERSPQAAESALQRVGAGPVVVNEIERMRDRRRSQSPAPPTRRDIDSNIRRAWPSGR